MQARYNLCCSQWQSNRWMYHLIIFLFIGTVEHYEHSYCIGFTGCGRIASRLSHINLIFSVRVNFSYKDGEQGHNPSVHPYFTKDKLSSQIQFSLLSLYFADSSAKHWRQFYKAQYDWILNNWPENKFSLLLIFWLSFSNSSWLCLLEERRSNNSQLWVRKKKEWIL